MPRVQEIGEPKWLTLGIARALLGINEATLRQWADSGLVQAFRTPGGHRRFSAEDIHSLMCSGTRGSLPGSIRLEDSSVLPKIRRSMRTARPKVPRWVEQFDSSGHHRMRILGRQLVDLCLTMIAEPNLNSSDTVTDLGNQYGFELASRGIRLQEALEGFLFFREATTEAIKPILVARGESQSTTIKALDTIQHVTDQILMGITSFYDNVPRKPRPKTRSLARRKP